jgi:hypothetical protein
MANFEKRTISTRFFEQIWDQGDGSALDRFSAEDTSDNDLKFGFGRESFGLQ